MSKLAIIISLFMFLFSCRNSNVESNEKKKLELIDSVLYKINLPELSEFDLIQNLELKAKQWIPLQKKFPLDSLFFKTFLEEQKIRVYNRDYEKFYYAGTLRYRKEKYLAISRWIGNGDECYMYLLRFRSGNIDNILMISRMYKSPDDYDHMKSNYSGGEIIRTTLRNSSEYSDSIIERFNIQDFSRIYSDTIVKK
jgi:hypothetical protein